MAALFSSSLSSPLRGFLGIVLVLLFAHAADAQLSPGFYRTRCPQLRGIVRQQMGRALGSDPRLGAKVLRLFFHDCFVLGCDASVLLDGPSSEKSARANRNLGPAFDLIDTIKTRVERRCPGVVSCADIVALATRIGIRLLGGPGFRLGLGRRDSLRASRSGANDLPPPTFNLDELISAFRAKGLDARDLTALSGGHTIGFTGSRPLDGTPRRFDNNYYRRLIRGEGVFPSDRALFNNGTTGSLVRRYAGNQPAFFRDFRLGMTRMSNINLLTGTQGEIRRDCRAVN